MPDRTSYEPGTPCWVDLVTPDTEAATAFYTGLFGWDADVGSPDGHTLLSLRGRPVAALMPHVEEAPPDTPALWTTYVSVTDVEATAAAAVKAGGRLFTGPADAGERGRYALLFDTQNAHLGLWQPAAFPGASLVNEPGSYCWSELTVRDVESAKAFYGATFGWEGETRPFGPTTYTEWRNPGGPRIGGMLQMNEQWPIEVAPHWMVYFAVADCDATAESAERLGGTVSVLPNDIPTGRFCVLGDPHGGYFSVIRLNG
jgi:predicted enzyme related to lactoylglutathione lyase